MKRRSSASADPEERFQAYREGLRREGTRLAMFVGIYRFIHERQYDSLAELNQAPAFFQTVLTALRSGIILWAHKLVVGGVAKEESLHTFLGFAGEHLVLFSTEGFPPYNRFAGVPMAEEADLVDHYKGIARDRHGKQIGKSVLFTRWGVRKHLLDDLYVRFFRLAETRIGERVEYGVVSFISNYSFYSGRSHPLMRESLLKHFHTVWIDALNGDRYRTGKVIPDGLPGAGTTDQSVFTTDQDPRGIQVGTGITTLVKLKSVKRAASVATVHYREFWGRSDRKRLVLLESLEMSSGTPAQRVAAAKRPEGPRDYEAFTPSPRNGWKLVPRASMGGFEDWPSLDELFPTAYQGVNPNRGLEGSVIDTDKAALATRMKAYYSNEPWTDFQKRHPVICEPRADYDPKTTRDSLRNTNRLRVDHIVPYVLFPLDSRWIYYETEAQLLNRRRPELWENLEGNEFLVAVPEPGRRWFSAAGVTCWRCAFRETGERCQVRWRLAEESEGERAPNFFPTPGARP